MENRLLRCLTVTVRLLLVEGLAELSACDFPESTSGGIPTLKEDWRWDDEEEAVLSTCSTLIVIIPRGGSRVIQFSHFSVKEFLMSSRLAHHMAISHGFISTSSQHIRLWLQAEAIQVLLEHSSDTNWQSSGGATPLYWALTSFWEKTVVAVVRRLLEHGAEPNILKYDNSPVLHRSSVCV